MLRPRSPKSAHLLKSMPSQGVRRVAAHSATECTLRAQLRHLLAFWPAGQHLCDACLSDAAAGPAKSVGAARELLVDEC